MTKIVLGIVAAFAISHAAPAFAADAEKPAAEEGKKPAKKGGKKTKKTESEKPAEAPAK